MATENITDQLSVAVQTIISNCGGVVNSLIYRSIRSQDYGIDRKLAEHLGYDIDEIRDNDWQDALDNEECDRVFEEQLANEQRAEARDTGCPEEYAKQTRSDDSE